MEHGILSRIHLSLALNHLSTSPAAVLGHVNGYVDVEVGYRDDHQRVERIKHEKEVNRSYPKVHNHREELKDKAVQECVQSASLAQGTHDFSDPFAEVEVKGEL